MNHLPLFIAFEASSSAAPWVRIDGLGIALAATVAVLGVTVLTYARRNLAGAAGRSRFFTGAAGILAGTLVVALAGRLSLLVVGWLVTSISVAVVLASRGGEVAGRTARRAAWSLAVGDVALLAAAATTWWALGDADLSDVGAVADGLAATEVTIAGLGLSAAGVVAVLLALAAMARAAQFPLHSWLPGTVNAPTPASALLHAGVVNAGGFLLVRMGPVFASSAIAPWLVVAVAVATILVAAGSAILRSDVKGGLATSTSAQMGFMLLAASVGAPIAAMSHLIGHALYKSSRFLGAGDAIRRAVTHRRWSPEVESPLPAALRAFLAVAGPAVGLGVGWLLVGSFVLKGADGWVLASAIAVTTVRAGWLWSARAAGSTTAGAMAGSAVLGAVVLSYLLVATGVELLIIDSVDRSGNGYVPAPLALAVLGALVAIGLALLRSERFGPRLRGMLSPGGAVSPGAPRSALRRQTPVPQTATIGSYEGAS